MEMLIVFFIRAENMRKKNRGWGGAEIHGKERTSKGWGSVVQSALCGAVGGASRSVSSAIHSVSTSHLIVVSSRWGMSR